MVINTKFDLGQQVFSVEWSVGLKQYRPIPYHVKSILVQKNSADEPWIRYYLDLKSGLYREVDLFATTEEAFMAINEGRI